MMMLADFFRRRLARVELRATHFFEDSHPILSIRKLISIIYRNALRIHDEAAPRIARIRDKGSFVSPEPQTLVAQMLEKAIRESVNWGDTKDYPTKYSVRVSPEAWNFYRSKNTAERLSQTTSKLLYVRTGKTLPVEVGLACDCCLQNGDYTIEASFLDSSPSPVCGNGDNVCENKTSRNENPVLVSDQTSKTMPPRHTLVLDDAVSAALYYNKTEYRIFDGATVGVERTDSEKPDVCFPYSDRLAYMSANHCSFHYSSAAGKWEIQQNGRNASIIEIDSEEKVKLAPGQAMELPPTCAIVIPGSCEPYERLQFRAATSHQQGVPRTQLLQLCKTA